jgi:hypothetical protein
MYKRRLLPSNKGNSLLYFLIMVKASEAGHLNLEKRSGRF